MNEKAKICCAAFIVGLVIGAAGAGFFFSQQRPRPIGELDNRYALERARSAEATGRLEADLERERELNRQLREHNNEAREICNGITDLAGRNVRNLQDAIGLIGEIRKKLKVLEGFYADRNPGGSSP